MYATTVARTVRDSPSTETNVSAPQSIILLSVVDENSGEGRGKTRASCPHRGTMSINYSFCHTASCSPRCDPQEARPFKATRRVWEKKNPLDFFHVCPLLLHEKMGGGAGRPVYKLVFTCPGRAGALVSPHDLGWFLFLCAYGVGLKIVSFLVGVFCLCPRCYCRPQACMCFSWAFLDFFPIYFRVDVMVCARVRACTCALTYFHVDEMLCARVRAWACALFRWVCVCVDMLYYLGPVLVIIETGETHPNVGAGFSLRPRFAVQSGWAMPRVRSVGLARRGGH